MSANTEGICVICTVVGVILTLTPHSRSLSCRRERAASKASERGRSSGVGRICVEEERLARIVSSLYRSSAACWSIIARSPPSWRGILMRMNFRSSWFSGSAARKSAAVRDMVVAVEIAWRCGMGRSRDV